MCIVTEQTKVSFTYQLYFKLMKNTFFKIWIVVILFVWTKCSYLKKCECGIPNEVPPGRSLNGRIIGGVKYSPHKYPWLAVLQLNGTFLCGGSIITDQYILSAAHCLRHRYQQNLLKVTVGEHNRCKSDIKTVTLSVSKIIKHEHFDDLDFSADIMLLKLSMKLSFNKFIRPICLPRFDITQDVISRYRGKKAKVIGWGKTDADHGTPTCLPQELQVPILLRFLCNGNQVVPDSLFCAGYLEGGKDSCQGDSGGPLQILSYQMKYEVIGIVSNGIGCALEDHPGLYTDVLRYLPWIWKNTEGSVYCW